MKKLKDNFKASLYIIDENYRILYANENLRKIFPHMKEGDYCYRTFCHDESVCEGCLLKRTQKNGRLFYNRYLKQWLEVSVAEIEWQGIDKAYLFMGIPIDEHNKNLLYNLTRLSAYDELYEINIKNNTYKGIYQSEWEGYRAPETGKITDAIERVAAKYIHPDDRKKYLEFWNLDTMKRRLLEQEESHILTLRCRRRWKDEYRWIVHTITNRQESRLRPDEDIFLCFFNDNSGEIYGKDQGNYPIFDPLTGLYQKNDFFLTAGQRLKHTMPGKLCMMAVDIEHFKLFNEWYGRDSGDQFLINIANFLRETEKEQDAVAGHLGNDDFAILLPYDEKIIEELQNKIVKYVRQFNGNAGFLPAFGIYVVDDLFCSASMMYDRAVLALNQVKGNYARRSMYYDVRMMQEIEQNYILLSEVQRALKNGEFTFYAQPKCNMKTGKIIGLESLVRWRHPEKGLVLPGEFVPFLEKNGFITELDIYIWEEVCKNVRKWIDLGHRPLPISVNVSQVDIFSLDLVQHFTELVKKYDIPPSLIEIEITESFYSEEYDVITKVIDGLRNAGFTILMDDFGSGYSSLNMLKDINVDILKIDMKFLELKNDEMEKGTGILETITQMARLMALRVIAEGVERKEQVDFLLDIGCHYCQGNYFYRPMPMDVFEAVIQDESNVDFDGLREKQVNHIRPKELLNWEMMSETMLNNILGAVAIYDVCDDNIELVRVNEQYYRLMDMDSVNLEEQRRTIVYDVLEEDREKLFDILSSARKNNYRGAQGVVRRILGDDSIAWIYIKVFFIREQDHHSLYYASLSDVTVYNYQRAIPNVPQTYARFQKNEDVEVERKMTSVLHKAGINSIEWNIQDNAMYILKATCLYPVVNLKWFERCGRYMKALNFPDQIMSEEYIPFGYFKAAQEFCERVKNNKSGESISLEFPLKLMEERIVWIKVVCETLQDETGKSVKAVGYYEDVSQQKQQRQMLKRRAETDALTGLYNRVTAMVKIRKYLSEMRQESSALIMLDLDNFKYANDVFGHAFGDYILIENAEKMKGFFRSNDVICRFGGDEFMILCVGIPEESLRRKLREMLETMCRTYQNGEKQISFSLSAGYVMIPEQGVLFEDLYRKADIALFAAKMDGKGNFKKYDASMKTVRYELVKE